MASKNGPAADRLARAAGLQQEPYRHDLLAALRWLEAQYRARRRLGESTLPAQDSIRLGQKPYDGFVASNVASFSPGVEDDPDQLQQHFFGLFGTHGPMPYTATNYVLERIDDGDRTLADFADMFHHRLLSFYYRSWANAQPTTHLDDPRHDSWSRQVGALFGQGIAGTVNRDAFNDHAKRYFSGHLSAVTQRPQGLERILGHLFDCTAQVRFYVREWLQIPAHDQLRLGGFGNVGDTGALGQSCILGAAVQECQHKFRIHLGPLNISQFQNLLPGGKWFDELTATVRNYVGFSLTWDVRLVLAAAEVPSLKLGDPVPLGQSTWLGERATQDDAQDVCLDWGWFALP